MPEEAVAGVKVAMKKLKIRVTEWPSDMEPIGPTCELHVQFQFGTCEMFKRTEKKC